MAIWTEIENDFSRVSSLSSKERIFDGQILLKLEKGRNNLEIEQESQIDCWAKYTHNDNSQEWMPCRIVDMRQNHDDSESHTYKLQFMGNELSQIFEKESKDIIFGRNFAMNYQNNFR